MDRETLVNALMEASDDEGNLIIYAFDQVARRQLSGLIATAILPLFAAKDTEIARLTAELERYTKGVTFTADPRDAEIERLRGALLKYGKHDASCPVLEVCDCCTCGFSAALDQGEG